MVRGRSDEVRELGETGEGSWEKRVRFSSQFSKRLDVEVRVRAEVEGKAKDADVCSDRGSG